MRSNAIKMVNEVSLGNQGMNTLLSSIDSRVARVLDQALRGQELSYEEGLILAHTTGPELEAASGLVR
jgi:hypothetical protein